MVQHHVGVVVGEPDKRKYHMDRGQQYKENTVACGVEWKGQAQTYFPVGVVESLSEKEALRWRSGVHEAASRGQA